MKIRSTVTRSDSIALPALSGRIGLEITFNDRPEEAPPKEFRWPGYEGTFDAEEVERVAAAIAQLRSERGDYRNVCPDHGYYESLKEGLYKCPRCSGGAP